LNSYSSFKLPSFLNIVCIHSCILLAYMKICLSN